MANLTNLTINDTGFIQLPSGTTTQRPASPATGYIRFNTTLGIIEYYNGTYWLDHTTGKIAENTIVTANLLLHLDSSKTTSYRGGNIWYDISSQCAHGIFVNGPTYSPTENSGGAVSFDGTNDYIRISTLNTLPTTQITMEGWIKPTRTVSTGTLRGGVVSATNTTYLGIFNSADGGSTHSLHWANTTDSSRPYSAVGNIPNNVWSHIVGTWDGSTSRAYVNGTEVWSAAQTGTIAAATYVVGTYGSGLTDGLHNFQGQIAIARMYSIGLSGAQVLQNYNAQKYRFGL
jgi:hypothetical protein